MKLLPAQAQAQYAPTPGDSAQQNEFPLAEIADLTKATYNYVIGPGDRLLVIDYSAADFPDPVQTEAVVLSDGTVSIHPIGVFKVAGMSLAELNRYVNAEAGRRVKHPDIAVSITKMRQMQVYLTGEVTRPGLYAPESSNASGQQTSGTTSESSIRVGNDYSYTLVGLLQQAGGVKDSADIRNIKITRLSPKQVVNADLWKLMFDGDTTQDVLLQPGDVVYVTKGGQPFPTESLGWTANVQPRIRVWGAVKTPGLYDLHPQDDMLSILAKAGGFDKNAKRNYLLLCRLNRDGTISSDKVPLLDALHNPKSLGRTNVKPGDVVVADYSKTKQFLSAAYYPLTNVMVGITVAIASAIAFQAFSNNNSGK